MVALVLRSETFAARAGVVAGRWASALLRLFRRGPAHGWDLAVVKWRSRVVGLVRHRWLALTTSTLVAHVPLKLLAEKGVLKQIVDRQRPGRTEPDPVLRDVPSAGASFPSGHAVIAFGIAALLAPYLGRYGRIAVWTLATLNSVARVYLGAHNPLDVVCGAGVGLLLDGLLTWVVGVRS